MVSCVGRGGRGIANEAYIRYYEAAPKTALEAAASDLTELQTMGLVSDDGARIRFSWLASASVGTPHSAW